MASSSSSAYQEVILVDDGYAHLSNEEIEQLLLSKNIQLGIIDDQVREFLAFNPNDWESQYLRMLTRSSFFASKDLDRLENLLAERSTV